MIFQCEHCNDLGQIPLDEDDAEFRACPHCDGKFKDKPMYQLTRAEVEDLRNGYISLAVRSFRKRLIGTVKKFESLAECRRCLEDIAVEIGFAYRQQGEYFAKFRTPFQNLDVVVPDRYIIA